MNNLDEQTSEAWKDLMDKAVRAIKFDRLEKAEELLLEAYRESKATYGPDHGTVGLVLLRLADVCEKLGKTRIAEHYRAEIDRILRGYLVDQDESKK